MDKARMAAIFNEWARRYADNPAEFGGVLDEEGRPFKDYGESCAAYFERLDAELPR